MLKFQNKKLMGTISIFWTTKIRIKTIKTTMSINFAFMIISPLKQQITFSSNYILNKKTGVDALLKAPTPSV